MRYKFCTSIPQLLMRRSIDHQSITIHPWAWFPIRVAHHSAGINWSLEDWGRGRNIHCQGQAWAINLEMTLFRAQFELHSLFHNQLMGADRIGYSNGFSRATNRYIVRHSGEDLDSDHMNRNQLLFGICLFIWVPGISRREQVCIRSERASESNCNCLVRDVHYSQLLLALVRQSHFSINVETSNWAYWRYHWLDCCRA